ncbi:MAG: ABC transporter ATP-binding protein [Clostridia bacterium]|nr:ABC transporter ATP-binding protein [Clostridia bacterium]MBR7062707.1 ABC transporter ATP-binding protein [Clostridia bacterium]
MPPGGPDNSVLDQYRVPRPKNIKDVPRFLKEVIGSFSKRMLYILKLVWEASPGILFLMAFMSVFNGVMPVVGSLIGKELLNRLAQAYGGQLTTFRVIWTLLVFQFAYLLLNNLVNRLDATIIRISGELVTNHIKLKIMNKAKEVDLASFDSPEFYAKMENANREAGNRPIQVLRATFSIASAIISIVSFIIVLAAVGFLPVLLVIVVAIPSTIINFVYRRKNHNYVFRRSKDRRQMSYYSDVIVNKDMVKEIRMLDLADNFIDRYSQVFKRYFKGLKKLIVEEFLWNVGATLLSTAVNCVLFVLIARGVFEGKYEIGYFSLYTGALNSIASGIATLITTTASIYEGTLFINNMIAFMEEEPTVKPILDEPRPIERGIGHVIEFRDVSFHYPGIDRNVINHVDLTIHAGETIVIVGLNGAGKTTLIKLLTRLYDPTEGMILLDGHDIREYDLKELYDLFGIVFQDYGKYAVSVRDNIAFGEVNSEITDDRIAGAAAASNATDFINALPDKFNTPLMRYFEDNGIELSIGQWQKLAIARAFYSKSDILILDEPTASLDPMAEQEIFNQFDELRSDKTSIFVSHRLSSATTADRIIVLQDGRIVESGNHSQLMNRKGEYYTLFSTQAKRYLTPVDPEDKQEE